MMIKKYCFSALVALLLLSTLPSCAAVHVRRVARRVQVEPNTLRVGSDLLVYQKKISRPKKIRYYTGTQLVCIIDKQGISWLKK